MNHKPYPFKAVVLVKGFNYDEFIIEGYYQYIRIHQGIQEESLMYTLKRKNGQLTQVAHENIRVKDVTDEVELAGELSVDQLLDMLNNYKSLHNEFGDSEYLNKQLEIEIRIKNKISNRR